MNWTAEEIVKSYNTDPSKANMLRIAKENNCTLEEIGQFLKNAAVKRKPGRPKKNPENGKENQTEPTKKDNSEKTSNKSDSVECEKPAQKYLIPEIVVSLTNEHIERLNREIEFFEVKVAEKKLKRDELVDFLKGGFDYGQKDGVHREI